MERRASPWRDRRSHIAVPTARAAAAVRVMRRMLVPRSPMKVQVVTSNPESMNPNGLLLVTSCAMASGMIATPMPPMRICRSAVLRLRARLMICSKATTWTRSDIRAPTTMQTSATPTKPMGT